MTMGLFRDRGDRPRLLGRGHERRSDRREDRRDDALSHEQEHLAERVGRAGDRFGEPSSQEAAHVSEPADPEALSASSESDELPEKVPITARLLLHESFTARRAAATIAAFTLLITVTGGILERVVDHQEFPTIGKGLWFALQTVTTVGYGDVTPKQADGRFIAAVVMLAGIGFLAVITASVTASLIESSRRRFAAESEVDMTRRLEDISGRLARIEAALDQPQPPSAQ
jgi:voltage-gated potassium channel